MWRGGSLPLCRRALRPFVEVIWLVWLFLVGPAVDIDADAEVMELASGIEQVADRIHGLALAPDQAADVLGVEPDIEAQGTWAIIEGGDGGVLRVLDQLNHHKLHKLL